MTLAPPGFVKETLTL